MLAGQVDCTFRFREVCACTARVSAAANTATTVLFIRAPRDWNIFLRPELSRRKPGAFGERFELRPHDARMHAPMKRPLREAAVGAGEYILASHQPRDAHDALGDELRMLDDVGRVAGHDRCEE